MNTTTHRLIFRTAVADSSAYSSGDDLYGYNQHRGQFMTSATAAPLPGAPSSRSAPRMKAHAEERLRAHLMKRHKVKDRGVGLGRFPSQQLYTKYELYKVPTTAGWKTADALA